MQSANEPPIPPATQTYSHNNSKMQSLYLGLLNDPKNGRVCLHQGKEEIRRRRPSEEHKLDK